VVLLGVLAAYPLVQLVHMALSGVTASTINGSWAFVGLSNFVTDIQQGGFLSALWRTVVFVGLVTIVGLIGGFATAVALRTARRGGTALLALMVFVWAIPPVVNGSVWKFLFDQSGLLNTVLGAFGLGPVGFLYNEHLALISIALVNAWVVIPFNALVFRAAILNIPGETFEAAQLDGVRPFQEIRYVIAPAVRPTALVLTVLTIVYGFRSFDFVYVMTSGGPGTVSTTLPYLGYVQAFTEYNYGLGSATAVLTAVLVLVLALIYARSIRSEEAEH
jgi:multiple sugar transport system permease protein